MSPAEAVTIFRMKHHTKDKGDIGVLKAQADLAEQGFMVLRPLTEHAPFDLVAYRKRTFSRVQVRYRSVSKNGDLRVAFKTIWNDKNGTHRRATDKREVDLFCVYCPETDECYYFDPSQFGRSLSLRVDAPKNGQKRKIKFAADYRKVP